MSADTEIRCCESWVPLPTTEHPSICPECGSTLAVNSHTTGGTMPMPVTVQAYLCIAPAEQDEAKEPVGTQRLFTVTEGKGHPQRFMLSHLATAIGGALFGVTGEQGDFEVGRNMVLMRCNVSYSIGRGMRAIVYPANERGHNRDWNEPIDYHEDTHREP